MDLLEAVLDEVALEGLDGISVTGLWLRLQMREPAFPLLLDSATKQLLWQALVRHPELDFYQLPEERPPLVIPIRHDVADCDPSVLNAKEPSYIDDVYPVHIITDNKHGIQGSCRFFKARLSVSNIIRTESITCEDAVSKWGETLVIVASQTLRYRALIGWEGDPSLELPDCSYCLLEKIGRSRWQGEIQKDLQMDFKVDAGKIHYLRRVLDRNDLITIQTRVIKLPNGTRQHSLLLLLKRFHVDRRNKYDVLAERLSTLLSERENQMETLLILREEMGLQERIFKRLYYYMATAGILKIISLPLSEIQPFAEHCKTKRGTDIMVRCVKLVKEYKRKDEEEDEEDDEDVKTASLPVDLIYEKDMLTQTYELIESQGTKGISQREIRIAMNVGKLEARMLCRLLQRFMLIKGFMEDEGRQRTTKFISHVFVEESELRKQFLEEKAKSEQLSLFNLVPVPEQHVEDGISHAPENIPAEESQLLMDESENLTCRKNPKTGEACSFLSECATSTPLPTSKGKARFHIVQAIEAEKLLVPSDNDGSRDSFHLESNLSMVPMYSADEDNEGNSLIEDVLDNKDSVPKRGKKSAVLDRSRETYRLLKRRNIIVETVKNLRLVESLFTLKKMIVEQEKLEGVSTKCCKKSIVRLVHKLSQEGLVRVYRTVVVQDGISKKVEFVVHPSVNPNDPLVKSTIEQIRFRMFNSTSGNRARSPQGSAAPKKEKTDEQHKENKKEKHKKSHFLDDIPSKIVDGNDYLDVAQLKSYQPVVELEKILTYSSELGNKFPAKRKFPPLPHSESMKPKIPQRDFQSGRCYSAKPTWRTTGNAITIPGLGRTLGYLPKMPRLKTTHLYLWYIVYGHPGHTTQQVPDNKHDHNREKGQEEILPPTLQHTDDSSNSDPLKYRIHKCINADEFLSDTGSDQNTEQGKFSTSRLVSPFFHDLVLKGLPFFHLNKEVVYSLDVVRAMKVISLLHNPSAVYVDEVSWMRFVPPATIHCEYGPGWVLVSDILLCLPLSIFIQIIQVSYKVDSLEDYLNDPIKKNTLIRHLPRPMRQQLLYKRRYVFSLFQGLQKLSCMGLVQFGPTEKFQEKDQVFVFVKKNATIVDTTTCEPHYNIAQANHPFDKRAYYLETFQDVENFWFDLQFVCLNTPLGVVRNPRGKKSCPLEGENIQNQDLDIESERQNLERKSTVLESIPGSREVVDNGIIPGDGLGAGGLDSSFYSHLKRNWIWISYIVNNSKKTKSASAQGGITLRLQTFLNKHAFPLGLRELAAIKCSTFHVKQDFLPKKITFFHLNQEIILPSLCPLSASVAALLLISSTGLEFSLIDNKERIFNVNLSQSAEFIQVLKESNVNRNKRVCGGKNQRRKRSKKQKHLMRALNEEKMKRARYHDEADQSALMRMTRLRVAWTAQEDGLLMLCRIASNILNRKVKRPFVPWQVVRDIMHFCLEESLDKTSHSIGRRARYIMKNPQTYLNYKVCLAEVYQDEALVEDFMTRKALYDDPKVCAEEFKEFVKRLQVKFSSKLDEPTFKIPDSVEELFKRFQVLAVGDESTQERKSELINSIDDIQVLVLQNLILSTLALSDMQMKSCRSLQTYRMYRQYREDILVKAFLEFQQKRLVNRRRGNHLLGPKKNRALPFLPMSFQLSQIYYRLFIWRFPSTICTESFEFLERLKEYENADQPDVFSFGDQVIETPTDMLVYSLDGPGGHCATVLSLMLVGFVSVNVKIPDQIVVVDSTLVDNEVIKSLGRDGLDDEDFEDDDVDENMPLKRKIEIRAPQASHTNYLLMRGCCAPGIVSTRNLNPNDNIVVNSCQVYVKLRNTPQSGRLRFLNSFADFMSDMPSLPTLFTELLNTKQQSDDVFLQHCVKTLGYSSGDLSCVAEIQSAVEACSHFGMEISDLGERFSRYESIEYGRTKSLHEYLQDLLDHRQLLQVGGSCVRLVARSHASPWLLNIDFVKEQATQDKALFNKQDSDYSEASQQTIEEQPESDSVIYEPPRKKPHLENTELGNTEGSTDLEIPVSIPVSDNTEDVQKKIDAVDHLEIPQEKSRSFLGRPWRIADGSLNKPVCKGMLEAVLYQIMSKPGITKKDLIHHYNGVLQPVIIFELLQVLEKTRCIKKQYIEKYSKATLCSSCKIPQVFKISKLSENLTEFYEATIDCTLRLGGIFPSEDNWNKWVL
ncbi:general transcription factor 3C polypeptide 1 [Gastrophryne carolinensis]